MILVSVGTHNQQFDRLLKKIDSIASTMNEDFVVQTGESKYKLKNCENFDYTTQIKFEDLCKKADIIIIHGGAGSIMTPLMIGKPTVVVPRRKEFGEHTNDHQMQITRELETEDRVFAVYDIENLEEVIKKAQNAKNEPHLKSSKIEDIINDFIAGEINEDSNSA